MLEVARGIYSKRHIFRGLVRGNESRGEAPGATHAVGGGKSVESGGKRVRRKGRG